MRIFLLSALSMVLTGVILTLVNKHLARKAFEKLKCDDVIYTDSTPVVGYMGYADAYALTNPVHVSQIERNDKGKVQTVILDNGEKLNYEEFCKNGYEIAK